MNSSSCSSSWNNLFPMVSSSLYLCLCKCQWKKFLILKLSDWLENIFSLSHKLELISLMSNALTWLEEIFSHFFLQMVTIDNIIPANAQSNNNYIKFDKLWAKSLELRRIKLLELFERPSCYAKAFTLSILMKIRINHDCFEIKDQKLS